MIKQFTPQDRRIYSCPQQNKVVMRCDPLAISLFKEFRSTNCNHCLKSSQTNRCSICKQYFYCSVECQKQDWKMHKNECQALSKITREMPCNMLLVLRVHLNNIDISEFYGNPDNDCDQQLYQQFQDCSAYLSQILGQQDILKLMQIQIKIQMNSFTINDINGDSIGIGLYTPANYFNHRCIKSQPNQINVANCSHFFNRRQLIVITNDSYQSDQELCISYANITNYNLRQKFLREQYYFTCDCDRCSSEKEQDKFEDKMSIKSEEYLTLLQKKKFKSAFKVLEELIQLIPSQYDNHEHPYLGWRMNEASKLAFHLNYLEKAETYSVQAIRLLEPYFSETSEFKELVGRLKDVQSEIRMTK